MTDVADQVKHLEHDLSQKECAVGHGLSKADFVAACIALRGCAAYLINGLDESMRRRKLDLWLEFPRAYLSGKLIPGARTGGEDFYVRWNAAVSDEVCTKSPKILITLAQLLVRNLINGPWNETSEALFDSSQWIY